jgi:hypothetical protein
MLIKDFKYGGWENNLQMANDHVELVVSLDVGPRILSYKTLKGENVLGNYPEQMGGQGEPQWMIRGGHRFWIAPEDEALSYVPDNQPVHVELQQPYFVSLQNDGVDPWKIRKEMSITLDASSSEVRILHQATNEGTVPVEIATWGLTVMEPGGLEVVPMPPLGEYPRDTFPNRLLVAWPYTDLSDARWRFGWKYLTLRQAREAGPTKLGLAHKEKWVAYLMRDSLFIKTFEFLPEAVYPDQGCNFETFTNAEMLQIESLGPLKKLAPGESVSHSERWYLLDAKTQPDSLKEAALDEWIAPYLRSVGL